MLGARWFTFVATATGVVGALASAGCFSEGAGTSDTGLSCPSGTRGCDCAPDGSCEAGLECHAPSSSCYEPTCMLGSVDCPCSGGQCLGTLQCIDDFCVSPGDTSGSLTVAGTEGTTRGTETTAADTRGPESDSEPSTTLDTLPTTLDTSADAVTDASADSLTTDGETCNACLQASLFCQCEGCAALAECIYGDMPVGECCANNPGHDAEWNAFIDCAISEGCSLVCPDPPRC